jgi:uncharacterized protein (DUF2147 family)
MVPGGRRWFVSQFVCHGGQYQVATKTAGADKPLIRAAAAIASSEHQGDAMHRSIPALAALALALASAFAAAASADPRGRYLTASGNLEVELAPCGDALCGTVSKVIADHSMSRPGETMQAVDGRPALGMKVLLDFKPDGDDAGTWQGRIYNRENGKTYDCRMTLDDAGNLQLRAYVGLPLFGKTQLWQRQAGAEAAK